MDSLLFQSFQPSSYELNFILKPILSEDSIVCTQKDVFSTFPYILWNNQKLKFLQVRMER